ncbi:hypothetical protein C1N70_03280 [Cytobacillus firmus]
MIFFIYLPPIQNIHLYNISKEEEGYAINAENLTLILTNISKNYMIKILPILHWPKGTVKSSFFFEKDGYDE